MATLLEDIVEWLVDNNLGQGDGIDLFRDVIPDDPDVVVTLFEYNSKTAVSRFNHAIVRYVQVTARDSKSSASRQRALEIFKLFQESDEEITDLPNGRWAIIKPLQSPFKISEDGKSRSYYGFNVAITTNCE